MVGWILAVPPAEAQQLSVALEDGRMTLSAEGVPLHSILLEWARIGGSEVTNLEVVTRDLISLEFVDVAEAEVLDTLLRDTQGYVLVARSETDEGSSLFQHLMILPSRAAALRPLPFAQQSPQALVPQTEDTVPRRTTPARNVSRFPPDDALVNQSPGAEPSQVPVETPTANRPGFPGSGAGSPVVGSARPGEISPAPDDAPDR